jgi:hypothetical protein
MGHGKRSYVKKLWINIYAYVYIYNIYVEMQFSRDEHPELPAILGFTRGTVFWPISKLPNGIIPGHRNGCFDGSYGPGLPSHNADLRVSMGLSRVKKKRFSWHWGYCTTIWWLALGENDDDDDDALDLGISLMLGQTHSFSPLERRKSGISISCFRWTSWFSALKGNPYRFTGTSTVDMARCKEGPSMPS